jgi:hypothetical protein
MRGRATAATAVVIASLFATGAAAQLTRGPYLQIGTSESAIIRWRTEEPGLSWAAWGPSPHHLSSILQDLTPTTEHAVQLQGLSPATRYYYAIGDHTGLLAGQDSTHTFRTAPVPGTRGPVRVWVIGDSGTADDKARRVRDAYLDRLGSAGLDVWLMLGDNAYSSGKDSQYQRAVFDMYPTILRRTFVWPTRGNHDDVRNGSHNDYYDFFTLPTQGEAGGVPSGTEAYYSFDQGNVHFVCLDSHASNRTPDGAMLRWLKQDLAATARDWTIAYWHHPPYTKGSHDSDDPDDSGGRLIEMRENVLPILDAYGVDLVLNGHSHSYERSCLIDGHYGFSHELQPWMILDDGDGNPGTDGAYRKHTVGAGAHEGTVYAVVGSSGKTSGGSLDHPVMIRSLQELGSMYFQVEDAALSAVWIDDQGQTRDSFRIIKDLSTAAPGLTDTAGDFSLSGGAPNPFRGETTVRFTMGRGGPVRLSVFDVGGRRVATLLDGERDAGPHRARWDGRSADGVAVSPGVYFAVLEHEGSIRTKKIVRSR